MAWNKQAENHSYSNLCFCCARICLIKPTTANWLRFSALCHRVLVDEDLRVFCTTSPYNELPDSILPEHTRFYTQKLNDYVDVVSFLLVNQKGLRMLEVEPCKAGYDFSAIFPDLVLCRDLAFSYHQRKQAKGALRQKTSRFKQSKIYGFLKGLERNFRKKILRKQRP